MKPLMENCKTWDGITQLLSLPDMKKTNTLVTEGKHFSKSLGFEVLQWSVTIQQKTVCSRGKDLRIWNI
jgi:hypothetical protein